MPTNEDNSTTANSGKTTNANLRPWKPGQSGNPNGRPKKNPVSDYLKEQLEAPIPQSMMDAMKESARLVFCEIYGESPTFGQMIAFKTIQTAAKGDVFALKELLDRVEGKVAQKHAGEDGGPIQVVVTRAGK